MGTDRDRSAVQQQVGDGYGPEIFPLGHAEVRRYRTMLLTAGLVGVIATLPMVAAEADVRWPVVAVVLAVTAASTALSWRPWGAEAFLTRFGLLVVTGMVFLLVMATGGATSPYEVLYVPVVGFAAAFRERRRFYPVLGVSVVAALSPSLLDPETQQLAVDVLISGAVGLTLVVAHRIASGLRDANRLYLSVLENHTGPTYLLDPDGTLRWVNGPGQDVLGMPLERIVGLPWSEVVAEGETERLMPAVLAALEGEARGITFRTDAPGGSYVLRGTIFPVSRYGRNVAVMGITDDVTELHAAFGVEALRWVLDSLTIPVAVFDGATRDLLYANSAAGQLTRLGGPEQPAAIVWDGLRAPLVEELPEAGGNRQVTLELNDGRAPRQLDVSIECLRGGRDLVVYTAVDATERGRRERELQRVAQIEREAAQRLREVDRLKNALLAAVSHELRTPATVIFGVARSLQRLRATADTGTRERLEDALVRQADRLEQLLSDLLDLGRLIEGTARAERGPFDVVELTNELVARAPQRHLIRVDAPPTLRVHCDRVQIERIVENLLRNSEKYAPGTPVDIVLAPREDGGFRLTVTDAGPGIPEEDLQRVFEPFYRIDLDHPQPGTGIGLALVAEFAAIHGGQARAERAEPGGGARIVVDIPERRTSDRGPEDR